MLKTDVWSPWKKGQIRMPIGVMDGAGATCFFGICKKARRLKVSCGTEQARRIAFGVMQDVGRLLYLPQQPEAAACLIRYILTRPAVLIFDYQDNIPVVTAWTGRGLTGWISLRRALRAFLKRLPKQLTVSEEPAPLDEEEARRQRRKEIEKEARASLRKKKKKAEPKEPANKTEEQKA